MKTFWTILSLLGILLCYPAALGQFLETLMMARLYIHLNPLLAFVVGGFSGMILLSRVLSYWKSESKQGRIWVVDERYLEEVDGIPYYQAGEITMEQKPVVIREELK